MKETYQIEIVTKVEYADELKEGQRLVEARSTSTVEYYDNALKNALDLLNYEFKAVTRDYDKNQVDYYVKYAQLDPEKDSWGFCVEAEEFDDEVATITATLTKVG